METGFVGLGTMGQHMVTHLLESGHAVTVYDERTEAIERLEEAGATGVDSPAAVAGRADVVFLSLPGPDEVEAVALGEAGLRDRIGPGTVVVDLTTSLPETTERVAAALDERGAHVLGAPVSGGERGARAGTLSIMAGGSPRILDECRPALGAFADRVFHVGERPGHGHAVKLLNNYLWGVGFVATTETLLLAERLDLDLDTVLDVLNASSGRNTLTEEVFPEFVLPGDEIGYRMALFDKDLKLFSALGEANETPLVLGSVVRQLVGYARSGCGDDADVIEAYALFDDLTGDRS